jgi:Protein of unknown function (DUF2846)
MRQSVLYSSVIFLFLVACTPKQIVFEAMQSSAEKGSIVYVYRPLAMANAMISPVLLLNGDVVSELKSGSYLYRHVIPGQQILSLDLGGRYKGNKSIVLDVKPNRAYFIRVISELRFEMNKPYMRAFNLESVDSSIALLELASISVERKSQLSFKENEVQGEASSEGVEDARFSIENTRNPFSR